MSLRCLMSLVPAAVSEELHFLAMGDWGGSAHSPYTTSSEVATAAGMDSVAGSLGAKFALALGDNFYSSGVKSVDDKRFDKTFEQCFSGSNLQASNGFTFHVVAGNHDHGGSVQAQIDYSSRSERWSFPSQYYSFSETAPDGATVDIVLFDTVQLSGISDHDNFVRGSDLPGPLNATAAGAQLKWLEKTLSQSTADYLIVGGHYPVYSIAEHGPTKQLQPGVFPYFRDNRVSAYVCGHDHNQQYIDVGDGIQYHVIGSAHSGDSSTKHKSTISADQLKFHAHSGGGFSTFSVSKKGMVIKHLDAKGKVLYTAPTIPPRGSAPTPTPPTPLPTPPTPTPPTPSPTPPTPTPPAPTPPGPSPSPAPGCDVEGCFQRCVSKYHGEITDGDKTYHCAKGCAGMSGNKIVDHDKYCTYDPSTRYDACTQACKDGSSSKDYIAQCKYGCDFWKSSVSLV